MQTLYKELCNAIEDREDLTFSRVAKYIEASKQCMSKFKAKGEIGFRKLLRLSYLLYPNNPAEKMAEWCIRLNSTESIKQSFEYAAVTRNIELLGNLITKHGKEKGSLSEYVVIYTLIYNYMTNKVSGFDLIDNLKRIGQVKDEALTILVDILKCYNYYFQKKFHKMLDVAREAESRLQFLGDKRELFIKECYLHRIAEVLGPVYLHLNKLNLARHYAFTIINAEICPKTVSDASYIVGMSYLMEDERKCVEYLQKSYDISKTIGDLDIEKEARLNLDFVKLFLNIELDKDSDQVLLNFQENRNSEINLNSMKEVLYQKGDDEWVKLIEARADGSVLKLYEIFQEFLSQANYYFSSIVARRLYDMGESTVLMEKMMKFTIELEESVYFEKDFISGFISFNSDCCGVCA